MAYEPVQKRRAMRRIAGLVATIILIIAGVSGAWYWVAGMIGERLDGFREALAREGRVLNCDGQDVRGYPFRVGVFCERVAFADPVNAITASGGQLRTAAQLYRPGHVVAELDGPLDLGMPGLAPLTLEWSNLQSSSMVNLGGPEQLSLVVRELAVSANDAGLRDRLATIGEFEAHARENPEQEKDGMLDVALSASEWRIDLGGGEQSRSMRVRFDAGFAEMARMMRSGIDPYQAFLVQGGSGELRTLRIELENGAHVELRGPLQVDDRGLVSGELTIDARDPAALADFAAEIFPPAAAMLEDPVQIMESLSANGGSIPEIKGLRITVDRGLVLAGFFPLGEIPPLFAPRQ